MAIISEYLTAEHKACDNFFSDLEQAVANRNWDEAEKQFKLFRDDTEGHFQKEEKVLFTALDEMMGMSGEGPTSMMKMEHNQMRQGMMQMEDDIQKKDADHFLGLSETFNMLIQQHNMKEEQIIYTMSDQHLGDRSDQMIDLMSHVEIEL
jgi:hemerythrin-like domain-containing protein